MKQYLTELNTDYPVRRTPEQKQAFRDRVKRDFPSAREETLGKHTNLVIGEPSKAEMIFCAHYDTPRRGLVPNLMVPVNTLLRHLYRAAILLPIILVAVAFGLGVGYLSGIMGDTVRNRAMLVIPGLMLYYVIYFVIFMGPANRNNYNDNTSGTAAVLELAARLGKDERYAFILFDNEEKGKLGSRAFAKAHPAIKAGTPVFNMDCVGNGSDFVIAVSGALKASGIYPAFEKAMNAAAMPAHLYEGGKAAMNSDHKNFRCAAGICACKKSKKGVFYTPAIHTKKDTVADEKNIEALTDALYAMANEAGN